MSWEKYTRVLMICIGQCRANAIHNRKCIILYEKWQPIMCLKQLNTSCSQEGFKGSHNNASEKSGAKPQLWEEFQYWCVQCTKASLSGCQHLPESYRHDDFLASLDLSQQCSAISPNKNQKADCLLLPWSWPGRTCLTAPTCHLSRSSVIRATLQGKAGRELRVTSTQAGQHLHQHSLTVSEQGQSQTRWSDMSGQGAWSGVVGDRVRTWTWNKAVYSIGLASSLDNQWVRQDEAEVHQGHSSG